MSKEKAVMRIEIYPVNKREYDKLVNRINIVAGVYRKQWKASFRPNQKVPAWVE